MRANDLSPAHRGMLIVESEVEALLDRLVETKHTRIEKPVHLAAGAE